MMHSDKKMEKAFRLVKEIAKRLEKAKKEFILKLTIIQ